DRRRNAPVAGDMARELAADCTRCAGLCCIAPAFAVSADFAIDKPAGTPCPNLDGGFRCTIHAELRERGFRGCAAFDCLGAGQRLVQETYGGRPQGPTVHGAFDALRGLHELLWYLRAAAAIAQDAALRAELEARFGELDSLGGVPPDELARLDLDALRAAAN